MFEKLGHLGQRILVSLVGMPIFFFAISFSFSAWLAPVFPLFAMIIFGAAMHEYYAIAKLKGYQPCEKLGIGLTVVYILAIFFGRHGPGFESLPVLILGCCLIAIFSSHFLSGKNPFVNIPISLFGVFYLTIPLSSILQINYFFPLDSAQDGRWWVVYLLTITFITDGSALFIGKMIGSRKLAPYISPKKTWEGAIGGFILAILFSLAFCHFANTGEYSLPIQLSVWQSIGLGGMISVLAHFGDLAESLLKRDVGVKDSSSIPGLGGMLDVVDSLIFSSPLLYVYLKFQFS